MKTLLQKALILGVLTMSIYSCCCPTDPNPDGTISEATAGDMSDLYIANQYFHINENMGGTDNLSVNFSMEDIEEYICLVKDETANQGMDGLGLRVYFAAKMETDGNGIERPRMTVFFVPTSTDGTSICDIPGIDLLNMGDSGNNEFGTNPCIGG